jgi:hypothetical protein
VPHIVGPLVAEDGAAAAVCSQWLVGWKATNEPRRRLKQVTIDLPEELRKILKPRMVVTPDGRLLADGGVTSKDWTKVAASDDSIFECTDGKLLRSTHEGALICGVYLEGYNFKQPLCSRLAAFSIACCSVATMATTRMRSVPWQTLELCHRFGLGLLNDAHQLAVGTDELYVCDHGNHRLQVFSLTAEHRRSIIGEWRSPMRLCFAKDRLYLVERDYDNVNDNVDTVALAMQARGQRVLVLSLQGDILQVVRLTHPTEASTASTAEVRSICCFDNKLLARYVYLTFDSAGTRKERYGVLVLQGLYN